MRADMIGPIVVIDEFYDDPNAIRSLVLNHHFERELNDLPYAGRKAMVRGDWTPVARRLRSLVPEEAFYEPQLEVVNEFRIALASDAARQRTDVHLDSNKWNAIVYLTPGEYPDSGISFYRHRASGAVAEGDGWVESLFPNLIAAEHEEELGRSLQAMSLDRSQWEELIRIPNRFNRALVIMASVFHGITGLFGEDKETARLTQHLQFHVDHCTCGCYSRMAAHV